MNLTPNFTIPELVPKSVWDKFGQNSIWFLDIGHVRSMQWLRDNLTKDFGRQVQLVVNDWATGGNMHQRGLRTPEAKSYSFWSQHSHGRACDFHSPNLTITEIYTWLIDNESRVLAESSFRAIEDITVTKTWLHIDSRPVINASKLLIVKP